MSSVAIIRHPHKAVLWAEFALLCVAMPLLFVYALPTKYLFGILWVVALYACWILSRNHGLAMRRVWNAAALTWTNLRPVFQRFALAMALISMGVYWFKPHLLLSFPSERPALWAIVMVLYPLLSVIPQEMIFRPFFFSRYAPLFPRPWLMLSASAITFGFAHVLFQNWVSVLMCMAGGLMFAITYHRTRSLAAVWVEHALYGCFIFTIGLGYYFYHGSVQVAQVATGA